MNAGPAPRRTGRRVNSCIERSARPIVRRGRSRPTTRATTRRAASGTRSTIGGRRSSLGRRPPRRSPRRSASRASTTSRSRSGPAATARAGLGGAGRRPRHRPVGDARRRGRSADPDRPGERRRLLGELDVAAQAHGLVCPIGVVGHTGVAGLTLGGGVGRLQRHFGLTIDNLTAVELVTADGRLVRATETEEPELFWGLRGAGWNFGIATAFEFRLQPFGPDLHRGVLTFPATQVQELWGHLPRLRAAARPMPSSAIFGIDRAGDGRRLPGRRRRQADRLPRLEPQRLGRRRRARHGRPPRGPSR